MKEGFAMLKNYHTHTVRCNHALGSEREYIEAAIKAGVKVLGFSDHAPYSFEGGYIPTFRMTPKQACGYVALLSELKEEYKNDIEIHIGFEAEYYPSLFDKFISLCQSLNIEYLILGQHCLHDEYDGIFTTTPTSDIGLLTEYTDQVIAGLETGKFSYFAHPDVFNFTGDDSIYREQAMRICVRAKELGIPLEYNLLGRQLNRHYPQNRFFEVASDVGNEVILGRDAHNPEAFGDEKTERDSLGYLKSLGITPIETLTFRKV